MTTRARRTTIRIRAALTLIAAALALSACGTWDPTADPGPEATRTAPIEGGQAAGGQAELTVSDGTFDFSLTDCFLSENDGVRFSGEGDDGARIEGEYDPERPEDSFVTVTNQEGETIYTSDSTDATAPEFEMTEEGFTATGAFTTRGDDAVDGSVSGAC